MCDTNNETRPMTVSDLIQALQGYPSDLPVLTVAEGCRCHLDNLSFISRANVMCEEYKGFQVLSDSTGEEAVVLTAGNDLSDYTPVEPPAMPEECTGYGTAMCEDCARYAWCKKLDDDFNALPGDIATLSV